MKKKIAILGSTGSIGKQTLEILKKNKKKFEVVFLSTNKNIKEISKQVKIFKPKNVIISDNISFKKYKKKNKKLKIFNDYKSLNKIIKTKLDCVISAISGFNGLQPTIDIIKFTKLIAIANKESIICGWNLISKELKKNKTEFIPVDSEHFSIWTLINNNNFDIDKIYITASGGPFINKKRKDLNNIRPRDAINHPKWKMGKKISVDSATMVNKVFEVIEAKKIFNINISKIKILLHPESYVHSIVKFKDGFSKILIHETDMKIPIYNSLKLNHLTKLRNNEINFNKLNNLNLNIISRKQYPTLKIIDYFSFKSDSLYETVLVSANDELVDLFLKGKIKFLDIPKKLNMIMKLNNLIKFKSKKPSNFQQIVNLNKYVRLKTRSLCVRSENNV